MAQWAETLFYFIGRLLMIKVALFLGSDHLLSALRAIFMIQFSVVQEILSHLDSHEG